MTAAGTPRADPRPLYAVRLGGGPVYHLDEEPWESLEVSGGAWVGADTYRAPDGNEFRARDLFLDETVAQAETVRRARVTSEIVHRIVNGRLSGAEACARVEQDYPAPPHATCPPLSTE